MNQDSHNIDHMEVDEEKVKDEFDEMNRVFLGLENQTIETRIQSAEMLLQFSTLNDPTVDAKRFKLLDMIEEFEIQSLNADNPKAEALLASLENESKEKINLFDGVNLEYDFLSNSKET